MLIFQFLRGGGFRTFLTNIRKLLKLLNLEYYFTAFLLLFRIKARFA